MAERNSRSARWTAAEDTVLLKEFSKGTLEEKIAAIVNAKFDVRRTGSGVRQRMTRHYKSGKAEPRTESGRKRLKLKKNGLAKRPGGDVEKASRVPRTTRVMKASQKKSILVSLGKLGSVEIKFQGPVTLDAVLMEQLMVPISRLLVWPGKMD